MDGLFNFNDMYTIRVLANNVEDVFIHKMSFVPQIGMHVNFEGIELFEGEGLVNFVDYKVVKVEYWNNDVENVDIEIYIEED